MKRFFLFLSLIAFTSFVLAADRELKFSDYDSALKLVSIDQHESIAKFEGHLIVTGTIFFEFDSSDGVHAVDILFAKFVPDTASMQNLPIVIAGYYPGPLRFISLEPANAALEAIYGKEKAVTLRHGDKLEIHSAASLELMNYTTEIECDSRSYWSNGFKLTRLEAPVVAGTQLSPRGC